MKTLIVDASVAIKWFFKEEWVEIAEEIYFQIKAKKIRAIVPEIFFPEFSNICWLKVKKDLATPVISHDASEQILDFPLDRHCHEPITDVAFDYALHLNVSAYDASYLTLAEIYGVPLITADKKLVKACEGKFEYIEYLGDLKL